MMRELTIQVPDELFGFVKKLMENLRGVQVTKTRRLPVAPPLTAEQQEFVDDLKESLLEVERHQRGEIKLQTMRSFLSEADD